MPRYFFDIKNVHRLVDPSGIDCANDEAAKHQARIIAARIAEDSPNSVERRIAVVDDTGKEIAAIFVQDPVERNLENRPDS
jgi:hypothetical protein